MSETLKFGNGQWAVKEGSALAYNSENGNFKPLPFTFDRSTSATRVNKEGLIEVVSNNEPRIDFKDDSKGALLLEPSRSNLIQYSEEIEAPSKWETVNLTTVSNSIISPNGNLNGTKIIRNLVGSGIAWIRQRPTVVVGENYVVSVFGKIGNKSTLNITYYDVTSGDRFFNYNLSTQSITGNGLSNSTYVDSGIDYYGNGWYRCYVVINALNTSPQLQISVGANRANSQGDFIYLWGAMIEQGSYATSYIPTQGSIGTRVAETCNSAGNDQVFNDSEGVLFAEISALADDGTLRKIQINDNTPNNNITIDYYYNDNSIRASVWNGSSQYNYIYTLTDVTIFTKVALLYKSNEFKFYVNGIKVNESLSGSTFPNGTLETLDLSTSSGSFPFYGNTKQIKYFNQALTDQELINLTTI